MKNQAPHSITDRFNRSAIENFDLIQILSEETGFLSSDIKRIIHSAPKSYKTYEIPKRTGGKRIISQPAREVKILQRVIIEKVLSHLPIHQFATAYRPGISILNNALPHKGAGRSILKMDFENFFPSIKSHDWITYCEELEILSNEDRALTASLFFKSQPPKRGLRLAIGAPSSPILSNILMYEFDKKIEKEIYGKEIIYTRYADDLTFSSERTGYLLDVRSIVRKALMEIKYPKLKINKEKTKYFTSKYRRSVTGLVLTNQGEVSLGRDKKRSISAGIHNALNGKLNDEEMKSLSGYLAYANSVEPNFLKKMSEKYGDDIMKTLKKFGNPEVNIKI
ncbi:retron St85 family RNA-directed DNA polymerase [Gluconobacter sphaericus]|uniref:retron St85 family RNA-directed DNA polymerase n=1 Tax=Gluconobacter sphaericus TaxID=574987 RepID=UPI0019213489|nr:retron St85 family RNA-directed DNA polymerase [Gluconobacter sphaericus]QQX91038.1 retron St85 family RNA-directed DNA polymerase [Gluconobacter sphaericus]